MNIILIKDWRGYKCGRVLTPGDGVADVLLRRGIASLVPPEVSDKKEAKKPKKVNSGSRDKNTTDD